MKMVKLMMAAIMAVGLTLGLAGAASAAAITCGDCHSAPPVDSDNCATDARGLHGTHTNYSSASMPKTVASYGKCAYCHTATTGTAPTSTHNNDAVDIASTMSAALAYNTGTATCTDACHKNEAATALWGNFTSVGTVKLNCNSCHDDSTAAVMSLSGAHAAHLGTAVTGTGLDAAGNAKCVTCHPDNTNDLWSQGIADDGSKKAYPHASDGTTVVSDSATVIAGVTATRAAGSADTCANACHSNATTDQWGATSLTCSSCHDDTGTAGLGGSHAAHIAAGKTCSDCHSVPGAGDTSHASALPVAQDNATVTIAVQGTFNDGANSCSGTLPTCHDTGTPTWGGTLSCDSCHGYPGGTQDWTANNGHAVRYDTAVVTNTHLGLATTFNKTTDDYAVVTADASKCGKCHSGGVHHSGTVDVAGNGNNYCGVGNFTPNVTVPGSNATCSNVSCHSGKTTPNWW